MDEAARYETDHEAGYKARFKKGTVRRSPKPSLATRLERSRLRVLGR